MLQFFKYVLATIVGLFLFIILGIFLLAGIGAAIGGDSKSTVEENTILKLNLNRSIKDYVPKDDDPLSNLVGSFGDTAPEPVGIVQIQKALANAKVDPNIKGIYLEATMPDAGYANLEEVRNALIDFKKSGKFLYTYGDFFIEKGYYLASVADKIYLNPAGLMDFNGLSAEYTFFKGALDKLEIKPVIFKVGTYKSAVEPFLLDKMSDASRQQSVSFLNSINDHVFQKIAAVRGLNVQQLHNTTDSLKAWEPEGALAAKLITNVGYYSELEATMQQKTSKKADEKLEFVSLSKYLDSKLPLTDKYNASKIAVLTSTGEINTGQGSNETIGSDKFVENLRKLRNDDKVKAIVLRINSPGGSALASDIMWNEIQLARKQKPVVASYADVAASGGYYMGMGTDAIVAQPTTITGSIGIFMMLFNFENFLKNKLGITTDYVGTNAHSEFPSVSHQMSAFENEVLQKSTNQGYEEFTSKAAKGRKMPIEKLKSLAEGRVWSGTQAKQNGLVDQLGGLADAIKLAAQKAKLKEGNYAVRYEYSKKKWYETFFGSNTDDEAEEKLQTKLLTQLLGKHSKLYTQYRNFIQHEGKVARLEYDIELK
jgi:protease IV